MSGYCHRGWSKNDARRARPDYLPEVLSCVPSDDPQAVAELSHLYAETKLLGDSGYIFGYCPTFEPRRLMNPEKQAALRRRKLRARVEKECPLFADEMEQRALQEAPARYSPEAIAAEQAEIRKLERDDTGRLIRAQTPAEALDFLRRRVVVPFCSAWVDESNRKRQGFLARVRELKERKGGAA